MRNLVFRRLWLISNKERAAIKLSFHPKATALIGGNDVGKSSVIKSIYWTLGADPARTHDKWKKAVVTGALEFEFGGRTYVIVRRGREFGVFDQKLDLLHRSTGVTSGIGPFLAELLGFHLLLVSRQRKLTIPPPAYAFLPFYVDQDIGWQQPWQSFDSLQQFSNWKKDTIHFHSGIKSNAYYNLRGQVIQNKSRVAELSASKSSISVAASRVEQAYVVRGLGFDQKTHQEAIEKLLTGVKKLRERRQIYNASLVNAIDLRTALDQQLQIAKNSLLELDRDASWLADHTETVIQCPTCGTDHSNSFASRFGVIDDRESCRAFIDSTIDEMSSLSARIDGISVRMNEADDEIMTIEDALNEKHGEVLLKDVIEAEGQRQAVLTFNAQIEEINTELDAIESEIRDLERQIKELEDPKRKEQIENFFAQTVLNFSNALRVQNPDFDSITQLDRVIRNTGSDQPRAVLAYNLAFLRVMHKYSSFVIAPFVVDSPNQQDQDEDNLKVMVKEIIRGRPDNCQLILGSVSLFNVAFDGKVVEFSNKNKVLRPEQYEEVGKFIEPLIMKMIS
ncbi:hypothetical protein [Methylobacterium sp. P1-11]|uniref:hypothetical protein n=1 Tax=Methylobacterium sp. P1-11 TaxID=2024616 RepID=UPI0011EDAD08|nr:hypothetical protein [Methylobacterium sp. P1-11]